MAPFDAQSKIGPYYIHLENRPQATPSARQPRPVHHRIPIFDGAGEAAAAGASKLVDADVTPREALDQA